MIAPPAPAMACEKQKRPRFRTAFQVLSGYADQSSGASSSASSTSAKKKSISAPLS
jgi:hypothetical protein